MHRLGTALDALELPRRVELMHRMLKNAEALADDVREAITPNGRRATGPTDVSSQRIWREVFETWQGMTRE